MTDPLALFDDWLAEARASELNDPEAMALATADATVSRPSAIVLLKGHGPDGFVFYTNEQSAKGDQLAANPRAALAVSLEVASPPGPDRRASRARAGCRRGRAISRTRARDSQLGAWASDQSRPLDSRATFEQRFDQMKLRFEGLNVPRPPHWGGYRVIPERIEFWSDRPHRLHERRLFTRDAGGWSEGLLYP